MPCASFWPQIVAGGGGGGGGNKIVVFFLGVLVCLALQLQAHGAKDSHFTLECENTQHLNCFIPSSK